MDNLISTQWSISQLIQFFQNGNIAIPEIQRDVVWKPEQVKGLFDSINREYPCGSLILWEPREKDERLIKSIIRPERLQQFNKQLPKYFLLDGQQRVTALASAMLNREELKNILFELEDEMPFLFANYKNFPKEIEASNEKSGYKYPWFLLNSLFDNSIFNMPDFSSKISKEQRESLQKYSQKFRDYLFPIQIIQGRDYATVGEVFARVNSQGTQLTGAEIHLANIVPHWPGITKEFRNYRSELNKIDYDLDLTYLMRAITVIECNSPNIKKLAQRVSEKIVTKKQLNKDWIKAKKSTDIIIKHLRNTLKLDKTKFFTSKNVLVPLVYYVSNENGLIDIKKLLRFFLVSQLAEHYGSSGESVLRKDLRFLSEPSVKPKEGLKELLNSVEQEAKQFYRGLKIKPNDITGVPSKNVMVLLMYVIMGKREATNFGIGYKELISQIPSKQIQLHHIFPFNFMMKDQAAKKYQIKHDLSSYEFRSEVNDIANLTFLSQGKNASIGDVAPWVYFKNETTKEMRKAHFIPEDPNLWRPENYDKFIKERRILLAKAMNSLLKSLK